MKMKTAEEFLTQVALRVTVEPHGQRVFPKAFVRELESRDAEIHALYAPVVEALDDAHIAICNVVILLGAGDNLTASARLREWLAADKTADALAAIKEVKG